MTISVQAGLNWITLTSDMARLRFFQPLTLGVAVWCSWPAFAKPTFIPSEIEGQGAEIIFGDLDGDGLQDAVLLGQTNLLVFFQDSKQGFTRSPQAQFSLGDQPAVVWPAKLGRHTASLLLMTSDGVTEFDFTNRTGPPSRQQIIEQPTVMPDKTDEPWAMSFPMSAGTGTDWPLLLVPVAGGLQVWQHHDTWRQAQFIEQAVATHVHPSVTTPGYTRSSRLSLCVSDVNGDHRDDLMIKRDAGGGRQTYALYLQNTNGLFDLEPALSYTNLADWRTTIGWMDINRDGKLDLIKTTVSDEPSFVPGLQSGKVLVAVYLADEQGRIPPAPQQVFRKSDWSAFLPMVDVDGDGYMDLALGVIPIDSRDGVRDMITAGKIGLNLKFHFFRPGSGFPQEPAFQRAVPIYYDHDLVWSSDYRFYSEKFVSLDGDFNGDGKKDLLVRDHGDAISVYFFNSRETGFSKRADLTFPCPEPMDWWEVQDLNGDGVSDLVVKLRNQNIFRIFTSRGK